MAAAKPVPEGYAALTAYLIVPDAAAAIAFYRQAFGADERMRLVRPDGKIGHAELVIGGSVIMLADEYPPMKALGPRHFGGSPVSLHLYVEDVDAAAARATAAGAKVVTPVQSKFYGDRLGTFEDPAGHIWHLSTHIEDVAPEEIARRAAEAMKHSPG